MSTKKYAKVQNIFETLISYYNLKGNKGLAEYLNVPYQTLMAWKKRDSIGDYSAFMDKCPGLRLDWLKSGEGAMFATQDLRQGGQTKEKPLETALRRLVDEICDDVLSTVKTPQEELDLIEDFLAFRRKHLGKKGGGGT